MASSTVQTKLVAQITLFGDIRLPRSSFGLVWEINNSNMGMCMSCCGGSRKGYDEEFNHLRYYSSTLHSAQACSSVPSPHVHVAPAAAALCTTAVCSFTSPLLCSGSSSHRHTTEQDREAQRLAAERVGRHCVQDCNHSHCLSSANIRSNAMRLLCASLKRGNDCDLAVAIGCTGFRPLCKFRTRFTDPCTVYQASFLAASPYRLKHGNSSLKRAQ